MEQRYPRNSTKNRIQRAGFARGNKYDTIVSTPDKFTNTYAYSDTASNHEAIIVVGLVVWKGGAVDFSKLDIIECGAKAQKIDPSPRITRILSMLDSQFNMCDNLVGPFRILWGN
jgi:hypothetical protein